MEFFTPGAMYASLIPGTTTKLIFDCRAVLVHPTTKKRFAYGFVRYEGTGFWRDAPVNYRNFHGWTLYTEEET
jgi:hypothetical protein